jgi:hypothetical protein
MLPAGNTIGWQQQYCREVNQQYTCTAYCAPGYCQGPDGLPSASCDVMTGQWTSVGGSCVPDNGPNACSALPPFDPPKNTLGWRTKACYTTGFGPKATTTCYATCINGCSGSGASGYDPYTVCDWSTGVSAGRMPDVACMKAGSTNKAAAVAASCVAVACCHRHQKHIVLRIGP